MMDLLYQGWHDGLKWATRCLYSLSPIEYLLLFFALAIGGSVWKQASGAKKAR